VINDWDVDDPNVALFGTTSNDGMRSLTAEIRRTGRNYKVDLTYRILPSAPPPRGQLVTFVTYPDFKRGAVDAYELFADIKGGKAVQDIIAWDPFTVAAIGDAGDTALTLNLDVEYKKQLSAARRRKRKR
jgi:hypothetical protein